ncbi:hypothetical protein PC114_g22035 [Phytophthora cactorum]|uniref:Uncharacterized protein n=1 Tax=Phytophthora cactorum TaxID=29920 RepID=A0A8T1BFW5_9STRA|nr:hypothetical protein PC114_g22035 [Phytophthora cactorum]KAG2901117.1 hypothetical protein PC117_g21806 [Phytophthora cactorum]
MLIYKATHKKTAQLLNASLIWQQHTPGYRVVCVMDASVPRECWRRCLKYPSSGICVAAVSEGKKMVVTETGWSSRVLRSVVDVTSPANQAEFFSNFIQMDRSKNFGFNWYCQHDSRWRVNNGG